jgi:hypothetical protein
MTEQDVTAITTLCEQFLCTDALEFKIPLYTSLRNTALSARLTEIKPCRTMVSRQLCERVEPMQINLNLTTI